MPPIRPLEDAFLAHLLETNENIPDDILKTNTSTETLTATLQKLNATSHALQQELYQHVQQHFKPFSRYYNKSQAVNSHMASITSQLNDTETHVLDTREKTTRTIETYKQMWKSSRSNKAKMDALQQMKQLLQEEKNVRQSIKTHQYLEAVDQLQNLLLPHLQQWEQEEAGDHRIVTMLKNRFDGLKQMFVSQLQESLSAAIQISHGTVKVIEETLKPPSMESATTSDSTTVHVRDVLYCFYQLGQLPDELMTIQHALFKNIFNVYFECKNCTASVEYVEEKDVSKGSILRINNSDKALKDGDHKSEEDNDDKPAYAEPLSMFGDMKTILSFLYTTLFRDGDVGKDKEMKDMFGKLLMPDLMSLMIQQSIAPSVPSTKYNLSSFQPIAEAATEFEKYCQQQYGFDVITETDVTTLSSYIQHIDTHYARKRREKILHEGRKVMVRRLYDTDQVTEEIEGHTYQYHNTQTPQLLNVFLSDTLSEAATLQNDGHPISAKTLIEGMQDLLDMYRAIMPSFHRTHYLSSAANSLVFRNDCHWLAHQLTEASTIQHDFDQWTAFTKEASVRLQELGNAWYEIALMRCVHSLQSVLEPLDGFTGMAENKKFQEDCYRAMSKIIELVGSYAIEIQAVVDEHTLFLDILGRMVDHVLQQLIQDIESLVDIGADESHIIAQNLNSLTRLVGAFDLPGQDATESFVMDLVPNWQKFWLLKDILEMNMREIMDAFRKGKLHMFEKSELVGLLCSLFADTELRERNIKEIKEGGTHTMFEQQQNEHEHETMTTGSYFKPVPSATAVSRSMATTPAAPTATATATASMTSPDFKKTTTTNTKQHLSYTPDDMDVDAAAEGWGDEDVLEEMPTTDTKQHLSYTPDDMEVDAAVEGWGDEEDDDLFGNEITTDATGTTDEQDGNEEEEEADEKKDKNESDSYEQQKKPSQENKATAISSTTSSSSSALNIRDDLILVNEADDEEEGDGWDDDEALFGEDDDLNLR